MESVREYIASVTTTNLFREEVGVYFRKKNVFIDTMDINIKEYLNIRFTLVREGITNTQEILSHLREFPLQKGTHVFCNYNEFGIGKVEQLMNDDLMLVKFKSRVLNTMCNSKLMVTVHDNKKRKLKVIL